jgi:hypothetical protein
MHERTGGIKPSSFRLSDQVLADLDWITEQLAKKVGLKNTRTAALAKIIHDTKKNLKKSLAKG